VPCSRISGCSVFVRNAYPRTCLSRGLGALHRLAERLERPPLPACHLGDRGGPAGMAQPRCGIPRPSHHFAAGRQGDPASSRVIRPKLALRFSDSETPKDLGKKFAAGAACQPRGAIHGKAHHGGPESCHIWVIVCRHERYRPAPLAGAHICDAVSQRCFSLPLCRSVARP